MTKRLKRMGRCFRCLHTWRLRSRRPSLCPRCKSRFYDVPRIHPLRIGNQQGVAEILTPHRGRILEIMGEEGAEALWVFGSVRRSEATSRSDVDSSSSMAEAGFATRQGRPPFSTRGRDRPTNRPCRVGWDPLGSGAADPFGGRPFMNASRGRDDRFRSGRNESSSRRHRIGQEGRKRSTFVGCGGAVRPRTCGRALGGGREEDE